MAFPFTPNVAVDIYRTYNPADPMAVTKGRPAVSQAQGFLRHHVEAGRFGFNQQIFWTNLLYLPVGTDVRSAWNSFLNPVPAANADTVVIDDYPIPGTTTAFYVVMVQLADRGGDAFLKVFLDKAGMSVLNCCPNIDSTKTLRVTISDTNQCLCLFGTQFPIFPNTQTGRWEGNFSACGHQDNFFWMQCQDPSKGPLGYKIGVKCTANGREIGSDSYFATSAYSCDPLFLQWVPVRPTPFLPCCANVDVFTAFNVTE
jgi:hypothetical protein